MAFVEARGIRFHVQQIGHGCPTIVLVHGLMPHDNLSGWYIAAASRLADRGTILMYDLRGFGLSDQPATGYTMDDMASDLYGLLEALGLSETQLVIAGSSFGATLAVHFALDTRTTVDGLALLEPYLGDGESMDFVRWSREVLRQAGPEARESRARELYEEVLRSHMQAGGSEFDEASEFVPQINRFLSHKRGPTRERAMNLTLRTSLIDDLAKLDAVTDEQLRAIACPTLLMYGEESSMLVEAERLAGAIQDSRIEIVHGRGHGMLVTAPEQVAGKLADWLETEFS